MILFYGRRDDPPLARAVEAARDLEIEHVVIDQSGVDRDDLCVGIGPRGTGGELISGGCRIRLNAIRGVYVRPLELERGGMDHLSRCRAQSFHEIFMEWLEYTPVRVLNRPVPMESNGSKPFQAQQICEAGFEVPETLITSDPEEARAFWQAHGRVIFKSISGIRSIVTELDDASADRLDRIRALPVQFQAYTPGEDVRVHVVGSQTFACAVRTEATDYRYAARDGLSAELTAIELPDEVRDRCIQLSAALELPLSGIDLRRRPDGGWVCFEVNPMPGYSFFESQTGLPISRAIVDLLAAGPASE